MALDRVKVLSSGGLIGTGYTNFYFGSATPGNITALKNFFDGIKSYIPNTITYTVPASGDTISEADGHLLGGWAAGTAGSTTGTGAATAASPAGFLVRWRSASVVDHHRPVGRTIIVPAAAVAFGTNGAILAGAASTILGIANTFLSASAGFAIWHRPVYSHGPGGPVLERVGSIVPVNSAEVPTMPTVLRSRRS